MALSDSIKKYFEPSPDEVRIRDVVRELPGGSKTVSKGILKFLQESGQSFFRGTAALASLGMEKPLTPSTQFQKALYGTDQPITTTSFGQEYGAKGKFAPVVGSLVPALDLIPGGKVSRNTAIQILKETNDPNDAIKIFKQLLGMSDEVATKYAPQVARFSDEVKIGKAINLALEESQSVTRIANKAANIAKSVTKERKFVTSARRVVPEADKLAGQYIPRSTTELAIKAKNLISKNPFEAEAIINSGKLNDVVVATASEYIKKLGIDARATTNLAEKEALLDKTAEIANRIAKGLTEEGRTIQAASLLGRMTPEGQLRFAAREIQRYNEANPLKRIPELTGQQASQISKEMEVIQEISDPTEKAIKMHKLQTMIQDMVPTPFIKKVVAVWKAGLLTGIKTFGLNLFSNTTHFATEVIKDIPASAIDSAAALFTGERTKTLTLKKAFEGMSEGAIKGVRYFSTGFDERNIGAKIDYKRVNFGKGLVAKAFQKYTDTVFRALAVGDQPYYYATLSRSLMDQALAAGKTQGLKGQELVEFAYKIVESPTEEMIRVATSDAATSVFINETLAGKAASKIQSLPGGEFIIPFGRTPSAVAMQAIAYSPVGIVSTIVKNLGKGKFNQREFSQGLGRGITGTAAMYIGMKLAENKMFSGTYPIGDEKEQKLQEAEGVKPSMILIDGKWRNPLVLGPAGTVLQAGAHLWQALEEAGSPSEAMSKAALSTGKSFLELPFLTGLEDFINAISDPERYAKSYIPGLVASFVPTLVSDVARSVDTVERRVSTTGERIKSRIPKLRETLEPKINILGEEVSRGGNVIETMFDPTRPSKQMETPVTIEFRRLADLGYRVSPTALGNKNGYDVLSSQENTRMWQITGKIIDQKVTSLLSKDEYYSLPEDQRAKIIEKIVSKSKEVSRATIAIELTEGLDGEELKKKLKELKDGGLLTRDVFSTYLELR